MEDSDGTCDNNSSDVDLKNDYDETDVRNQNGNPKLADALSKVLRMTQKKPKSKRSIVLSRAKLHGVSKRVKKDDCGFEIEPNLEVQTSVFQKEEQEAYAKTEINQKNKPSKKKVYSKHELLRKGRVIPSILDKEKDRHLARIATRGVVQLFNAVRQQQTTLQKQLSEKRLTEAKKEKILKSVDRKSFLNALSGSVNISLSKDSGNDVTKTEIKDEPVENEEPSWEVLRNDFMMNPKLKDWDKKEEELSS